MFLDDIIRLLADSIGLNANSIGQQTIADAINRRMVVCDIDDAEQFYQLLQASHMELTQLIEEIVVPETWFFRDEEVFKALEKVVVNELLVNNPDKVLRIASIPCSTGEEPYTIAMALLDAGLTGNQFSIDAIDISLVAVNRAREAIYSPVSFRSSDQRFREKYFSHSTGAYLLDDEVKSCVNLYHGNVLEPPPGITANQYDVIFCRNLLIYLNEENRNKVINMLTRQLATGGLLFMGHAEANLIINHPGFRRLPYDRSFAFIKTVSATNRIDENSRKIPGRTEMRPFQGRNKFVKAAKVNKTVTEAETGSAGSSRMPGGVVAEEIVLDDIESLLKKAHRFADQGRYNDARLYCNQILEQEEGVAKEALYLLGLLKLAEKDLDSAADFFRKVLYLDPLHPDALLQLILVCEKNGDIRRAKILRKRLINLSNGNRTQHG